MHEPGQFVIEILETVIDDQMESLEEYDLQYDFFVVNCRTLAISNLHSRLHTSFDCHFNLSGSES